MSDGSNRGAKKRITSELLASGNHDGTLYLCFIDKWNNRVNVWLEPEQAVELVAEIDTFLT